MLLDAFMKIEEPNLEGESTDSLHGKEIEIVSFEQTVRRVYQQATTSSTAEPKVKSDHGVLTVIKPLDKTSPKLWQAASAGTTYKKVTLCLCQPSGTSKTTSDRWKKIVYYQVVLEGVHLARMHLVADPSLHFFGRETSYPIAAGEVLEMGPLEEIDLSFKKVQWTYKGGGGSANISGSWNLLTNASA